MEVAIIRRCKNSAGVNPFRRTATNNSREEERRGEVMISLLYLSSSPPLLHNYISCISVGSRLKLSLFRKTFIGKKPILKIYSNFTIEWDSSKEEED